MKLKTLVGVLAVAGLAMPGIASATNGYFSHGYGMKAKGMAGAATATASDTFGGANNPAGMVFVGDRLDVGVDWFRPIRSAERTGETGAGGSMNGRHDSGSEDFAVPEFGFNMMMGDKMSFGVTVYGNGGMNTDYEGLKFGGGTANMLGGSTRLGVDLLQLVIAPTFAYKLTEQHAVGVSPLIGYQRFKAEGLQNFVGLAAPSANGAYVTNQGYDNALGYGVRLGYMGKLNDMFSVGAAYASKIKMSSFDKYRGLFAEQGDFDMPENWNVGVAIKPTQALTVAIDYQRINYGGVKAIANPSANALTCATGLGSDCGAGFGWGNVDVTKLGVEYVVSPKLTLRAGISHNKNPITSSDVTFNIIAPGVETDHYTLGLTYGVGRDGEITVAYMHAKENTVTGTSLFTPMTATNYGTETIRMYQDSLGIAYGMKF